MEDKIIQITPLLERLEQYGKTSCELIKLKAIEKASGTISHAISRTIFLVVFFIFITLFNIGVALWLSELLGKIYYGFFCVAGFYGVVGGVLYFFMHNWMKRRASNHIISQMLN